MDSRGAFVVQSALFFFLFSFRGGTVIGTVLERSMRIKLLAHNQKNAVLCSLCF